MKKTLIALTAVLLLTGMTAGVVGHDCPDDADFCIQNDDGSSQDNSTEEDPDRSNPDPKDTRELTLMDRVFSFLEGLL